MDILQIVFIIPLLLVKLLAVSQPAVSEAVILLQDLIDWLRTNDAYVNENVTLQHIDKDDPSSPLGVYAARELKAGEIICRIPHQLIVKADKWQSGNVCEFPSDCGTIEAAIQVLSKNDTPYAQYLASQKKSYTPAFWSKAGKDLLQAMLNGKLPPNDIDSIVKDWVNDCNGDIHNPLHLQAVMIVKARADYEYLVPFYDMFNHHNGKYNVKHAFNPYEDPIDSTGYQIATTKDIHTGEQLYNSYNRCNVCNEYYDWFGTPEIFLHYGFIEEYPQRWLFDLARIKFDLKSVNGSGVAVDFLVPPSKKGVGMLKEELDRLQIFSKNNRDETCESRGIPEYEWALFWEYFDALFVAMSSAVNSNITLSDDVWTLGEDWWIKDGTLKADERGEHSVRSSTVTS